MSAAAWRWVWQQPASLSDLWRLTRMAGTSSSRCPSASAGWWPRPAAWKDRSFTMPEPARFYYSAASRVGHLGTANQRPAYLSDPGRTPLFSGHPSAQAMAEVAAWRRPTSPTFSSSRAGWRRRQTAWKGRIFALRKPARLFLSDLGQARQFSTAKQQQRQTTKPHLYLVLDDYKEGFTIHKMDIDIDLNVDCGSAETPGCLPEPPVLRIHYPSDVNFAQISALGSHIIAICPSARLVESGTGATITFDTKTALFSLSRILPRELLFGYEAAIAVRNRLYVFESSTDLNDGANGVYFGGGLHCLAADPNDDERYKPWRCLFYSSQFSWSWTNNPPVFLFDPKRITGYGVHPQTGTIFLSAFWSDSWGTFSYRLGGSGQWKHRGDWVLPFKGPAHYDKVLGAWVGLHLGSLGRKDADGYLCACCVVSGCQPPKLDVGREKLFLELANWRHVDAKLVYMGEPSKYCLMERLVPDGADRMNIVIRLTTFKVMYGENGELRTMAHRPARFYKAPSYCYKFDVQAFWM
ncbi:uncharacterized protein LOC100840794 isoform X1 [Brachypodium distachyon]|uniref:uncharacterized protein LOC100840794 isoform X1 n=1 Tax=Brachypodium distachyon TaxID=15368 RepID=UPI000D0E23A8|nr:uncharacterized protein LOC100840794 isoform X1 [Brachypodium distachyon]|eukprot:XP_024311026.1 uncharacterized protein LOC100840794 isoform X1 [Brachypodium distachyon]